MKIEIKDDLNKSKKVLEKIAPASTQQISIPIRLGQFTGKKLKLLRVSVGSVENKLHILRNANQLNEDIGYYLNAIMR